MYYEEYEEKMLKLAQIRDKIYKWRFLILGVLAFILAVIFTLIGCTGSITKQLQLKAEYTYGEVIKPKSSAFLAKTSYQYNDGKGWKQGVPKFPGEYTVRAVAKKGFGGYAYSKLKKCTIKQKPLEMQLSGSVVYGENPILDVNGLVYEDYYEAESLQYTFADFATAPTVKLQENSFRGLNSAGEEITSYYELQGGVFEFNAITIRPRPITLQFDDGEKTYDGTPLSAENYTITQGELVYGDTITVSEYASRTLAGTTKNTATVQFINTDGEDVSRFYNPTKKSGSLVVSKRAIEITTHSASKKYDATSLTAGYEITGGSLANGDYEEIIFQTSIIDALEKENVIDFTFYNSSDEEVKGCYQLTLHKGTLTVTPRTLLFGFEDMEHTYDGTEVWDFSWKLLPCDGFAGSDELHAVYTHAQLKGTAQNDPSMGEGAEYIPPIEVGEYALSVASIFVYDGTSDKSHNYKIENESGLLKILQRAIVLQLSDVVRPYNGKPLTSKAYTDVGEQYGVYSLLENHFADINALGSITEIGHALNMADGVIITDQDGNPVTRNYDPSIANGLLSVIKRKIVVAPLNITKPYDGTAMVYPTGENMLRTAWVDSENEIYGNALYEGCTAMGDVYIPYLVDKGSADTEIVSNTFVIRDKNGEDVTSKYYEVSLENGRAEISPRILTIASQPREAQYTEGAVLQGAASDCYIMEGSLVNGDTIAYEVNAVLKAKGETVNRITKISIYDGNGNLLCCWEYIENGDYYKAWTYNFNYQIAPPKCGKLRFT